MTQGQDQENSLESNAGFAGWLPVILLGALLAGCSGASSGTGNPVATPSPAPATVTALGSDQVVFDSDRSGNHEIFVMNADGTHTHQLTSDSAYENWWPRISPDRKTVLFYRAPAGRSENYAEASLWRMNADGNRIAMFGSAGSALEILVTGANGGNAVQYTNRGGINTDVSWSPDGGRLLFNGCPTASCTSADFEIYVMPATPLAGAIRLTNDTLADYDPYFSPDGGRIAWLTNVDPSKFPVGGTSLGAWAIRIANADGSNAGYLINDGNINSKPAWSSDGQTIFFHRMELDPLVEAKFGVFRMNRDGTGIVRLTATSSGNNEFPSN